MSDVKISFKEFLAEQETIKEDYNGWTNYATWRVNLEIFYGRDPEDYKGMDQSDIADSMKDEVEEVIDMDSSGIANDYARAFISDVNWWEIAEHYLPEEDEDEED